MVIDASALLAVLLEEPYGEWVVRMLENHPSSLCMSTVNLTETLIILADRRKGSLTVFEQKIYGAGIAFAPTTILHAQIAAQARHTFHINLGGVNGAKGRKDSPPFDDSSCTARTTVAKLTRTRCGVRVSLIAGGCVGEAAQPTGANSRIMAF